MMQGRMARKAQQPAPSAERKLPKKGMRELHHHTRRTLKDENSQQSHICGCCITKSKKIFTLKESSNKKNEPNTMESSERKLILHVAW
jgi:hypothetical protein